MSILTKTLFAVIAAVAIASPALAEDAGNWNMNERNVYMVDMKGAMKVGAFDPKMRTAMMRGAKAVPKGTIFFMHDGQLYMRTGKNFDRNGQFMFQGS